jgi:hypothetical protein
MMLSSTSLLSLVVMGAVLFLVHLVWKSTAVRAVHHWCRDKGLSPSPDYPARFRMGRPAHVSQVVLEGDDLYICEFDLYSGFGALPEFPFGVWGAVELISKVPFHL